MHPLLKDGIMWRIMNVVCNCYGINNQKLLAHKELMAKRTVKLRTVTAWFWSPAFFPFCSVWRFVTRGITSPCARCVTVLAATGNWSQPVAPPGPATCSTTRPPSSSPSSWRSGVGCFLTSFIDLCLFLFLILYYALSHIMCVIDIKFCVRKKCFDPCYAFCVKKL